MHGGVKFYRGSAAAARSYVEADRSRADDYYLAEGTGVAERYVATTPPAVGGRGVSAVQHRGTLDGGKRAIRIKLEDLEAAPQQIPSARC
jgi:exodeoxyribonuclease V alpha subunit